MEGILLIIFVSVSLIGAVSIIMMLTLNKIVGLLEKISIQIGELKSGL